MKPTCRYIVTAFLSASLFVAKAKEGNTSYNSPVQFMQNKGQITDQHGVVRRDIDAKVEANGVVLFVGDGELHYQWTKSREPEVVSRESGASGPTPTSRLSGTGSPKRGSNNGSSPLGEIEGQNSRGTTPDVEIYRMDVKLMGANKNAQVKFEEPTGYYENYYLAHTGEVGVKARGFQRVVYKDIYPNIDLVFYTAPAPNAVGGGVSPFEARPAEPFGRGGSVKYDFVVHPGGNPADIKLRYEGATEVKIVDGTLVAITPFGTIIEEAPYSYNAETKEQVTSSYTLSGNTLSFDVGSYVGSLVIDPALKWGTYYGSNDGCNSRSATTDLIGNPIVCGQTEGNSNVATTGAHQVSYVDSGDGFVTKFDTAGQRLWSTYYGGQGWDRVQDITTDHLGNIYLTGGTGSDTGIATAGSFQDTIGRGNGVLKGDAFIVKLNGAGMRQWATYFGDTSGEEGYSIACDMAGNVYVGGNYLTLKSMATPGAFQLSPSSSGGSYLIHRGFIAKFNPSGGRIWATHYNGSPVDIVVDPNYNVYIAGFTNDTANIASSGAFQTVCNYCPSSGNNPAGFFARFDSSGNRMWGSYYNNSALINSITYDSRGDIYIAGYAHTLLTGIATTGAHQTTGGGNEDAYLAKFSASGSRLWATFYGGTQWDFATGVVVDNRDNVYVTGWTSSTTGIATAGSHKPTYGGTNDMFLAMFNTNGQRQYGTYYGGTGSDWSDYSAFPSLNGVTAYREGRLYFGSFTRSSTGIATSGTFRSNILGTGNTYLVQFLTDTLVYIRQPYNDTALCIGDTLKLQYGTMQKFRSNNSFTVQLSNSSGSFASPTTIGTASTNTGGVINCPIPNVTPGSGYRVRIIATAPADTSEDNAKNIRISSYPANFTAGSNSPLCSGDTLELNSGTTTTGVTYSWAGPGSFTSADDDTVIANTTVAHSGDYYITVNNNGCMVKDTVTVVVNQTPQNVIAANNGGLCTGDTLLLTSSSTTSGVNYAWTGPNNYNTQNVTRPNVQIGDAGTYTVTVTLGSCSDTAMTTVVVNQGASVNIAPLTPTSICTGDTAQFAAFPNNAGTNPQLQWLKNGVAVSGATGTLYKSGTLANGDVISVLLTPNTSCPGAKESNKITMTVQPILTPTVTMTADNMPPWNGGLTVTFTATPTHGGTTPEYQWKRNGQDITGATGATWGVVVNALNDNEDICVVLKSNYECAVPDTALSNCITTAFTGVGDIVHDKNIKIYPNPVSGNVTISSTETIEKVEILNLLGQKLLAGYNNSATMQIDMSGLVGGVYIIKVNDSYISRIVKE